ncbi:MAG: hypothetical protein ABI954_14245 [Pyrinomonadaceae bacterium]
MKTLIFIGGFYNLAFAIFHLSFWKLFGWETDLRSLSAINRPVIQILNLRLIFVFLIFACVSFFHAPELAATSLGKTILLAISLFWFGRAIEQIVFFKLQKPASIFLFVVFLIGTAIYFLPVLE